MKKGVEAYVVRGKGVGGLLGDSVLLFGIL